MTKYYGLDSCRYFSGPGLSWDAMLKMTGIELELISDIAMHLFVEKGMRGGISNICKSFSKSNNKYMRDCNISEKSKFIIYLDTNNLYVWAMSKYLPYGKFAWLSEEEIKNFVANSVDKNSSDGYILEVDLEYPDKLNHFHNDYSLAPEKLEISNGILSSYCSNIADKYEIKVGGVNKLVPKFR